MSGKKETSPSRKRDTALDAVCPARLKGSHTHLIKKYALHCANKSKAFAKKKKRETVKQTGNSIFRSAGVTQRRKYSKYKLLLVQLCFISAFRDTRCDKNNNIYYV